MITLSYEESIATVLIAPIKGARKEVNMDTTTVISEDTILLTFITLSRTIF